MAISISDPAQLRGATAYGADGDKLGKVDEVFLDDATGKPEWAAIKTGLFGTNASLVPLEQATFDGSELRVPYSKDQLKSAPNHDIDQPLTTEDEAGLYRHYGMAYTRDESPTGTGETGTTGTTGTTGYAETTGTTGYDETSSTTGTTGTTGYAGGVDRDRDRDGVYDDVATSAVGRDTSGPTTDDAMTRSEERLRVGTAQQEVGRARLRKFIVTENVTQTVPVSHEEVRIEREPITEANRGKALDGPDLSEEEHEVTLHAERAVVEKEVVPVERVRLGKETTQREETVTDQVRSEQIEVDDAATRGTTRDDRI